MTLPPRPAHGSHGWDTYINAVIDDFEARITALEAGGGGGPVTTPVASTDSGTLGANESIVVIGNVLTSADSGTSSASQGVSSAIRSTDSRTASATQNIVVIGGSGGAAPMPRFSVGLPAYESGGFYPASNAIDADYYSTWRSVGVPPQWHAIDISSISDGNKATTVYAWLNSTGDYYQSAVPASLPTDYKIQGNTAASAGSAPTTGWTDLVTVTANPYSKREHTLDLTGYNWVRFYCTASAGAVGANDDVSFQVDLFDASAGRADILMLGDSITNEGTTLRNIDGNPWTGGPLATLIQAALPSRDACILGGGNSGMNMSWANINKSALIDPFSGKYVAINYGTNDANQSNVISNTVINAWYADLLAVVDYIISSGKVAIVGMIPWGSAQQTPANAAALNLKINQLYIDRPSTIQGPDQYSFFQAHPNLIRDGLHPTYDQSAPAGMFNGLVGYEWWMRNWRDALVANLF
jgi:hypothetical protein